jgi:hypothetical protein
MVEPGSAVAAVLSAEFLRDPLPTYAYLRAQVAIGELLARTGDALRLAVPAEQITRRPSGVTRSVSALPAHLDMT